MKKRTYAVLAAAASAAVVGGMSASPAQADSVGGYPCGLSTTNGYDYVIANCNTFAVSRRIIRMDYTVGSCRHIDGRSWVSGYTSVGVRSYEGC